MAKNLSEGNGNQIVDRIFARGSQLPESLQDDGVGEDNPLYEFALMAQLAAGLHDSKYNGPNDLEAGLNMTAMAGIKPLLYEDQGPQEFGFDPSGLAFVLAQRRTGNGDAALEKVLQAPRLTRFGPDGPILSDGKRFDRLTKPGSKPPRLLLANMLKPETGLTPLTLTRVSKNVYPPIIAVLTETLSPALARVSPRQALKITKRLATIQLVADNVRPEIEAMVGAVAESQARQIGTFMGSIERAIATAAAGLHNLVGREVTDFHKQEIRGTIHMDDNGRTIAGALASPEGRQIGVQRERATTGALRGVRKETNIHRERLMAAGTAAINVKPFRAYSRTAHFAAAGVSFQDDAVINHHVTDTGAYASATGPAVCASSATVVEASFHSEGFEVEINVRP